MGSNKHVYQLKAVCKSSCHVNAVAVMASNIQYNEHHRVGQKVFLKRLLSSKIPATQHCPLCRAYKSYFVFALSACVPAESHRDR